MARVDPDFDAMWDDRLFQALVFQSQETDADWRSKLRFTGVANCAAP